MLIVDAANVVGARPDGWWRDRPGAARRLVERITQAVDDGRLDGPVIVVLEGAARRGVAEDSTGAHARDVTVVHAPGSGDDTIVAVVASHTAPPTSSDDVGVTVVTADRALRERVTAFGATVIGPTSLLDRLPP